ncbi:MAG: hypothetical protein JNL72_04070 [Flavipsychrobacter sp.]|nr:hypothetical protein [Flavipsychrobacter sp.]
MKKVKLFSEETVEQLQRSVNDWLLANKAIGIIRTDMQCSSAGGAATHQFYILYEVLEAAAEIAVANQAAEAIAGQAVVPDSGEIQLQ